MLATRSYVLILWAIAVTGCGGGGSTEEPHANECPLIAVKSEQTQGGFGGCVVPASSTQPVNVDGVNTEIGFWLSGSGSNGTMSDDLRFDITVRHLLSQGLVECSFTIDGTIFGERTHICPEPFGAVHVWVTPQ